MQRIRWSKDGVARSHQPCQLGFEAGHLTAHRDPARAQRTHNGGFLGASPGRGEVGYPHMVTAENRRPCRRGQEAISPGVCRGMAPPVGTGTFSFDSPRPGRMLANYGGLEES